MGKYRFNLDLQQFNDEVVIDPVDPSSVVTGDDDAPNAGSASALDQQDDVTKQESFAARLREKEQAIEQRYEPHKQAYSKAEQIAKAAGFDSTDAYFAAVEAELEQRRIEQESKQLGIDPETYNQYFAPVHTELNQTKQQLQQLQTAEFNRNVEFEYNRLATQYPDFKQHEEQVFKIATELRLPPNRLEDAYRLATYDARIAATKLETEQQVLANVTGRDSKQVLSAGDKGHSAKIDPANMSLKEIEELSARVQQGERIVF
jgi:predicted nucleic acid-binding protein